MGGRHLWVMVRSGERERNSTFERSGAALIIFCRVLFFLILIGCTGCGNPGQEPEHSGKGDTDSVGETGISGKMFRHHFITTEMPTGKGKGWGYGTPALADFDNDGDLDFAFGVREDSIYWFEFREWGEWKRHTVGPLPLRTLGAATLDVDGDGHTDIITGKYGYRNPGNPKEQPFELFTYDPEITSEIHDIVAADIDGDGNPEIVAHGDREGLFWYKIPDNPVRDQRWPRTTVTLDVLRDNEAIHGGFSPNGAGDLTGNGYADIVLPDRWLENRDGGTEWEAHELPFATKRGPWGLSGKSWIVDLNGDGRKDVVMAVEISELIVPPVSLKLGHLFRS